MTRNQTPTPSAADRLAAGEAVLAQAEADHRANVERMAALRLARAASGRAVMEHRALVATLREEVAVAELDALTPPATLTALQLARDAASSLHGEYETLIARAADIVSNRHAGVKELAQANTLQTEAEAVWDRLLMVRLEYERLDASRRPPALPPVPPAPTVAQVIAAALSPRRTGVLSRLFG